MKLKKEIKITSKEEILKKIEQNDLVIYLDECAAGSLSGDLFVCGLVIKKEELKKLIGVNDSKKLSAKKRAEWFVKILEVAYDYEIVRINAQEIDRINVFQARMKGFKAAIDILSNRAGATYAIIDGNKKPENLLISHDVLIEADAILPGVSCASIIAKHSHTLYIEELCKDETYKKYGFDKHKGYGTKIHKEMLNLYGPIKGFHRMSFEPVYLSLRNGDFD